jgi:hypothetical protein
MMDGGREEGNNKIFNFQAHESTRNTPICL